MPPSLRRHRCVNEAASLRWHIECTHRHGVDAPAFARWRRSCYCIGVMCGRSLLCRLDLDAAHLPAYQQRARPEREFSCNLDASNTTRRSPNEPIPPSSSHPTRDTTTNWAGGVLNPPSLSREHSTIHDAVYAGEFLLCRPGDMPLLGLMQRYNNILGPDTLTRPYGVNSIQGRRGCRFFIELHSIPGLGIGSALTPALLKMWHVSGEGSRYERLKCQTNSRAREKYCSRGETWDGSFGDTILSGT
jgi:hypothetical protein